jgi:hypothetical protein
MNRVHRGEFEHDHSSSVMRATFQGFDLAAPDDVLATHPGDQGRNSFPILLPPAFISDGYLNDHVCGHSSTPSQMQCGATLRDRDGRFAVGLPACTLAFSHFGPAIAARP